MTFPLRWIPVLLCALVASTLSARTAPRRLFVEPFTTKEGSEKLRGDVAAELKKSPAISLTGTAAAAELILGGGGEIWVHGYRSLNPRSGRRPSNGTPVYGGFLSVELRDPAGETQWSYLVTPGSSNLDADDIARDLSKQIAKHVAQAVLGYKTPSPVAGTAQPAALLRGAGATFPYPLYAKWFTNYRRANPAVEITYQAVGSEAGVRSLLAGDVDFAGSDNPEAANDNYLLFPSAVGAVVPIVNLPGFEGQLSFTPEILAGIYLGRITKWNDPWLRQSNPRLHLPDLDIAVIHRSDGSGTSYVWTDYLSKISPEWRQQVGTAMAPQWPLGRGAQGNEGVATQVKERGGAIGYVEFIYALQNHLSFGKVRNPNGEFIAAGLESIGLAATHLTHMGDDLKVSIVNAPDPGAYPISSFTWLVVPARIGDEGKRTAISGFLKWMLGPGQTQAAALGYLGLPKELVAKEEAALGKLR